MKQINSGKLVEWDIVVVCWGMSLTEFLDFSGWSHKQIC